MQREAECYDLDSSFEGVGTEDSTGYELKEADEFASRET
jgi:hypothetical protein